MPITAQVVFDEFQIWPPAVAPVPLEQLVAGMGPEDTRFVTACYGVAQRLYASMKPRKNGQSAFTHPTNVANYLRLARCQPHVIAAGLLHDVPEERIDLDKAAPGEDAHRAEGACRTRFVEDVLEAAGESLFPRDLAERVVEATWTLTRHKADLYYKSISGLFTHPDLSVRLVAALVKLADRMHNIQTIDNYADSDKLYQCFKNLFILNNAKQLVAEVRARKMDGRMVASLERLFKKCGKATFQALLRLAHTAHIEDQVFPLVTYLALALRKYTHEHKGLNKVTEEELFPGAAVVNLYHGIVKKYDHKLHHEDAQFDAHKERELAFCRATFASLGLSDDDLLRALSYKDAMALGEVVASLLYREGYVIAGFECSRMCRRGRNCMKIA
ncbi:MAG TPA: HD domain-containing protein [Myxococcota bacterium]|nr:HD domain-containing protein [Myxococcota bacterium]